MTIKKTSKSPAKKYEKPTLKKKAKSLTLEDKKSAVEFLKSKLPPPEKKLEGKKKLKIDGTPKKNNKGADPKITELVLRDLELCFMIGMTT
jgi:hypothetical protein